MTPSSRILSGGTSKGQVCTGQATDILPSNSPSRSSPKTQTISQVNDDGPVRKGKWSIEEENFANKIILLFNKGVLLDVQTGVTLRTYLSEKLNCDPMRITKKYAGAFCIGKQVFQPNIPDDQALENAKRYTAELQELEAEFRRCLGMKKVIRQIRTNSEGSTSKDVDEDDEEKVGEGGEHERDQKLAAKVGGLTKGKRSAGPISMQASNKHVSESNLYNLSRRSNLGAFREKGGESVGSSPYGSYYHGGPLSFSKSFESNRFDGLRPSSSFSFSLGSSADSMMGDVYCQRNMLSAKSPTLLCYTADDLAAGDLLLQFQIQAEQKSQRNSGAASPQNSPLTSTTVSEAKEDYFTSSSASVTSSSDESATSINL